MYNAGRIVITDIQKNMMLTMILIRCALPDLFGELVHLCGAIESMDGEECDPVLVQYRVQDPRHGRLFADDNDLIFLVSPEVAPVRFLDNPRIAG